MTALRHLLNALPCYLTNEELSKPDFILLEPSKKLGISDSLIVKRALVQREIRFIQKAIILI